MKAGTYPPSGRQQINSVDASLQDDMLYIEVNANALHCTVTSSHVL